MEATATTYQPSTWTYSPSRPTEAADGGPTTILLVDDEEAINRLARSVLEMWGYRVLVAYSPEQALQVIRDYRDPIHLFLIDLTLPRMTGRELAKRCGELRPQAKKLYISGGCDFALLRHGICRQDTHFIGKPFRPAALIQKVRQILAAD